MATNWARKFPPRWMPATSAIAAMGVRSCPIELAIPLRERPTPRTRPIAPHSAEETVPLTAEGHTLAIKNYSTSRSATSVPERPYGDDFRYGLGMSPDDHAVRA